MTGDEQKQQAAGRHRSVTSIWKKSVRILSPARIKAHRITLATRIPVRKALRLSCEVMLPVSWRKSGMLPTGFTIAKSVIVDLRTAVQFTRHPSCASALTIEE